MLFEDLNLNKPLLNALDDMGYVNPTPIQIEAFAPILSGADIVGIAQTGTGKTFAFLMPLLRLWKYTTELSPRIVILVPTRELVVQIVSEIEKLAKYMPIRVYGVYGGANINTQKSIISQGLDIIVGTPGRLMDLSMNRALKLKKVKHFVLDEVDEMLELGFSVQLHNILNMLPDRRQNLFFSATLSPEVEKILNTFFQGAKKIEIAKTGTPLEQINQSLFHVPNFYTKLNLLSLLLERSKKMTRVLVFVRSKRLANLIYDAMHETFGEAIGIIHSNKSQNQRLKAVEKFRINKLRVLISTDVIARGVDITEVSHVINFDLPDIPEIYMHRIGRTGRADKNGIAISFVSEYEVEYLMAIESLMQRPIPISGLPEELILAEKLLEEEKPVFLGDKQYRKEHTLKGTQGAFQEKSAKNSKINLGGPGKRKPRKTKTVNRGNKKRMAKRKRKK